MGDVTLTLYGNPEKGAYEGVSALDQETAIRICAQAKVLAPVNKIIGIGGQLRNTIMWRSRKADGGYNDSAGDKAEAKLNTRPRTEDEAIVGLNLDYGIYQEFGTKKMKPQPYLRPAAAEVTQGTGIAEADKIVNEWMDKNLKGKKNVPL